MKSRAVSIIRGIAVLGIVLVHLPQYFSGINPLLKSIISFGQMGCSAFFMLSSFCLCWSKNSSNSLGVFYRRRFFALAPAYWSTIAVNILICLISIWLLGFKILPSMDMKPLDIIVNILLLNGLTPYWGPMNCVVMGGWFVGTLMVLYLLFPILSKLYFWENEKWESCRYVVFPFAISAFCMSVMIISGWGQDSFCIISSVKYFSFVNQLPCFALGFSLYDLSNRNDIGHKWLKFFVTLIGAVILFYGNFKVSYVICPVVIGISTIYLFLILSEKEKIHLIPSKIELFIAKLGDKSYAIYLSHFWIVFALVYLVRETVGFSFISENPMIVFLVCAPVLLVLVYFLAMAYDKWIVWLKLKINTLISK